MVNGDIVNLIMVIVDGVGNFSLLFVLLLIIGELIVGVVVDVVGNVSGLVIINVLDLVLLIISVLEVVDIWINVVEIGDGI